LLALAGCGGGQSKVAPGEVAIEVTDEGFVPATVTVPKGRPATLVFTRKIEQTCAKEVVFASNGEKHDLPLKQAVRVTLPADRPDTMDYACGMNMLTGKVVSE
jgi:plastocyanin domain-containing protein